MITLSLLGAGQRGLDTYAKYVRKNMTDFKFVAACDIDKERLNQFSKEFNISDHIYNSVDDFFGKGKLSDLLIISTLDDTHFEYAKIALKLGYDLVLEKPISSNINELIILQELAQKLNRVVLICHVLRYHPMWQKIKQIIDSNELGKIMSIQHNENIGHYHYAHSYARGNWRKKETSGPLVLTKSSHDLDILYYLVGSKIKSVSSFASQRYFIKENMPDGAAKRCFDCKHQSSCRYNGMTMYTSYGGFYPLFTKGKYTKKAIREGLKTTDYGECIYQIDHDIVESQSSILEFDNGVNATFNLSAFTRRMHRSIKIMCEYGEIRGNDLEIEVINFSLRPLLLGILSNIFGINYKIKKKYKVYKWYDFSRFLGHIKADHLFMETILNNYKDKKEQLTSIDDSIHSHFVALAIDHAKETKTVVDVDNFIKNI